MPRLNRSWTIEELRVIYDSTSGYCSICHRKVYFTNYGKHGSRGAWHVDHTVPVAVGGTNRINNLRPACIRCNLDKGTRSVVSARAVNGVTRAPYSRAKARAVRSRNTLDGAIAGAAAGAAIAGPSGALVGGIIGGFFGHGKRVK